MSTTLVFRTVVAVGLLSAACSQDPGTPPPSASGDDSNGPTQAGSAPSDTSTAGAAGTTAELHWKVLAESEDPTVYISVPVAASRGRDAAVAYVEQTITSATETSARVVMQRFGASGERIGSLLVLGEDPDPYSNVTLASDGKHYAACWNAALEVHCSLVDEQGQVQRNALAVAGKFATIVAGARGWALAYSGSDQQLRLQALTSTLAMSGSFIGLQWFGQFGVQGQGPLFAATPSGYALVAASEEGGDASLLRLSVDLQSVASASALGHELWSTGQLAASDTRAAVSLAVPYGSYLLLLDQQQLTAELPVGGGGKLGMDEALLLTEAGIGAAWLQGQAQVRWRSFADGHDADIGFGSRIATSDRLGLPEEGTDSYQQLVKVGDHSLLVTRALRDGALRAGAIQVATLKLP